MIVISRFRVEEADEASFRSEITAAHRVLAARAGYLDGTLGRNLDDPELWLLQTRWENAGSYRRALSSYEVKVQAVPVLSQALDEPSAYEVVTPGSELNRDVPRQQD